MWLFIIQLFTNQSLTWEAETHSCLKGIKLNLEHLSSLSILWESVEMFAVISMAVSVFFSRWIGLFSENHWSASVFLPRSNYLLTGWAQIVHKWAIAAVDQIIIWGTITNERWLKFVEMSNLAPILFRMSLIPAH